MLYNLKCMKGHKRKMEKEKDQREWKGLGKEWGVWSVVIRTIYGNSFRGIITKDFLSVMTGMSVRTVKFCFLFHYISNFMVRKVRKTD